MVSLGEKTLAEIKTMITKIESLEKRIDAQEAKLLTCVGDKCKVIEDRIAIQKKELEDIRSAIPADFEKKMKDCVGNECKVIIDEIKKKKVDESATEIPAEPVKDENAFYCETCDLELPRLAKKCPHCGMVYNWENTETHEIIK